MPCTIKNTKIAIIVFANLSVVGAEVDVSRQDGIGAPFTTIHKLNKGEIILRRTNLIYAVLLVERIRRYAEDQHYGHRA